jgi:hypothetical protein
MRAFITLVAASILVANAQANENCDHEYLGSEDLAIMASVRPAQPAEQENQMGSKTPQADHRAGSAERICLLPVRSEDPQLSPEAGWDPVMKRVNCQTGEAVTTI